MLVLSRKKGQEIIINDNIFVQILDCKKDIVKIGVTAPANFTVHRREVYELIKESNKTSSNSNLTDIEKLGKEIKKSRQKFPLK